MAKIVTNSCFVTCSFGAQPVPLRVTSQRVMTIENEYVATVLDSMPNINIPSFALCSSPTNPQVVAAQGVPQPCAPPMLTNWSTTAKSMTVNSMPALMKTSSMTCPYGGRITCKTASSVDAE